MTLSAPPESVAVNVAILLAATRGKRGIIPRALALRVLMGGRLSLARTTLRGIFTLFDPLRRSAATFKLTGSG
jgi:hypothetical protein